MDSITIGHTLREERIKRCVLNHLRVDSQM